MPTGYTAIIEERDVSFPEFVWRCARAFGALVEMRDDSLDAPIPEEFKPSTYHAERLREARLRLAELETLGAAEAKKRALVDSAEELKSWRAAERDRAAKLARYDAMAAKVRAWEPPTPEHAGLRDFMLDQIRISTEFMRTPQPKPEARSGKEWLAARLASAQRDVNHHANALREERERVTKRNEWIAALRNSVPPKTTPRS